MRKLLQCSVKKTSKLVLFALNHYCSLSFNLKISFIDAFKRSLSFGKDEHTQSLKNKPPEIRVYKNNNLIEEPSRGGRVSYSVTQSLVPMLEGEGSNLGQSETFI